MATQRQDEALQTVTLGRSKLEVSRIAYGSGPLGGAMGHLDEETGIQAVRRARELGINLFDTASHRKTLPPS